MPFVLDSSVALSWLLSDETNPSLDGLSDRLADDIAFVPPVWPSKVGNVLLIAAKRGKLTLKDRIRLVKELRALPVEVDVTSNARSLEETLTLAQKYDLTTYDASYIELARRREVPLATLDNKLRKAWRPAKIAVLPS